VSGLPRPRRCLLFCPADRPERYTKAIAAGADAVCVDLEDAVAPGAKETARRAALPFLAAGGEHAAELVLRVNSPKTEAGLRDLLALREAGIAAGALMIPKVDSPEEVGWVEGLLAEAVPGLRLIPMVETGRGLGAAAAIAAASPRVEALMFGGVDLSAELGCAMEWEALLHARSVVVHAAATAGVQAIDMPLLAVSDDEALEREARGAARLGFTGKAAIHPRQVAAIQAAFSPGEAEVRRAREVVAAYERNRGGVLLLDGRLVERPVIRAAERTLAIARAAGLAPAAEGAAADGPLGDGTEEPTRP
jgi:citrate lyase beta subunit